MLLYCPHCGAAKFISYRAGDLLMCKTCGAVVDPDMRCATRLKLEVPRMIIAGVWLSARYGNFTRSELASHLGVSNSPALREQLRELASRGILREQLQPHPQNGCATLFYSRPVIASARSAALPAARAFAYAGAIA